MSIVSGGGFRFSATSVGGEWSWFVYVNNIQNAGQKIQIQNIQSPYGPLYASNVPIPSDIILAMSDSLSQFQQQLFPLLYLSSQSSYSVTVTEGDPIYEAATLIFQNNGAFGSFMTAYVSPDSPWLSCNPTTVVGIGKNQQGQSIVNVSPTIMLASSSPYHGHVTLQDNAIPANSSQVTFNVVVLPRPTIGTTPHPPSVTLTYNVTTQTSSGAVTIVIDNSGPVTSVLSFVLKKILYTSSWLNVTPSYADDIPSGDDVSVVFSVISAYVPPIPGTYSEIVRIISPNATNTPVDIPITLNVIA